MKKLTLFIATFTFLIAFAFSCHKKCVSIPQTETNYTIPGDSITHIHTYRNDVPPPPTEPWSTLDTTDLDICQDRLWDYLKTMYPTREENYWNYNIYSIKDEPDELYANRDFIKQHTYFFGDTIYSRNGLLGDTTWPCINVDSTFFLEALGPPTFKSYLGDQQVNYFYSFKLKYRHGPCPHIFNQGNEYEFFGDTQHIGYCANMRVNFLQDSGRMIYIHFFGPG